MWYISYFCSALKVLRTKKVFDLKKNKHTTHNTEAVVVPNVRLRIHRSWDSPSSDWISLSLPSLNISFRLRFDLCFRQAYWIFRDANSSAIVYCLDPSRVCNSFVIWLGVIFEFPFPRLATTDLRLETIVAFLLTCPC